MFKGFSKDKTRKAVVVYMKDQGFSSCSDSNNDKTYSWQNKMDWFIP